MTINADKLFSPADHLKAERILYTHHGIYLGNNKVVHYLKEGVSITDYDTFCDNSAVEIVKHPKAKRHPKEVIVRALTRVCEDKYNLVFNNREHFCNWCIDGLSESDQVLFAASMLNPKLVPFFKFEPYFADIMNNNSTMSETLQNLIDKYSPFSTLISNPLSNPLGSTATLALKAAKAIGDIECSPVEKKLAQAINAAESVSNSVLGAVERVDSALDGLQSVVDWFKD
ncbi:MAG: lecithin retinol acyltransferase family protein [Deltaproteobacteria bacterium]|jgi:hypothetical protein|nr:lecithin retinol acyltransferase family protein [Deltaproteobacteria bacterium]